MAEVSLNNAALSNAISLYRQPLLARNMIRFELPVGMSSVLKIAAEGVERAALDADHFGATPGELHQASVFYLQTVVFHEQASDARLLALTEPVSPQELRNHKRMIFKWLHPDRNHNSWESKLFLRIKAASLRLEQNTNAPFVNVPSLLEKPRLGRGLRYHSGLHQVHRQILPGFWRSLLSRGALPLVLSILFLVASGVAIVAMTSVGSGFDFTFGVGS